MSDREQEHKKAKTGTSTIARSVQKRDRKLTPHVVGGLQPKVDEALRSSGKPLEPETREFMEERFSRDFSQVRVHTDAKAAESAQAVNAQAYTVGQDVVFGGGQYAPETAAGKKLVAHELAHVVQQERGGEGSSSELRADAASVSVMNGGQVSRSMLGGAPFSLQMKPDNQTGKPAEEKRTVDPNSWSKNLDKFVFNSAALTREHYLSIDTLAAEIAARAGASGTKASIVITGHTDTSGDEKYNEALGLRRASSAKAALEAALKKKQVSGERIAPIAVESAGETRLAKETADNVREPLNRRVEITVTIEGSAPATPAIEQKKKPINLNLPPDYKLPEETLWERMERQRRKVEEFDRTHPRKNRSVTDVIVEGVTNSLEPIIKKLPVSLRQKAREGIRKGIEAGTEKACEAAIDASGVTGQEAEAMKAACKAALKTKPGEQK